MLIPESLDGDLLLGDFNFGSAMISYNWPKPSLANCVSGHFNTCGKIAFGQHLDEPITEKTLYAMDEINCGCPIIVR